MDVRAALALLAVGLVVSSVFVSRNAPASIAFSIITVVHLRFGAAIYFLARRQSADASPFLPLLGWGLVVLTALTAFKFATPPPAWMVPGGMIEWGSALPGFISVRHFGSWTGAIAAGLMMALLYGPKQAPSTGWLYLLAAGLTCWSGTRAAILAMTVVALIAATSLRRLPRLSAFVHVGGLSALAMVGALIFSMDLPDFALFQTSDYKSVDTAASGRFELWHDTFWRWLDAPLFGWGSGSTFWEVYIGWAHTQPHNAVLQFLISWGAVGASGALWLLGRSIVATARVGMEDDTLRPIAGMLYSLVFMSLLEGMLHYPRFIMLIMIAFGLLFAARERRMEEAASGG